MSEFIDSRDLPIFIHSELDDLGLTSKAFRVYAHLARRAGKNGAFPSYASMGKICFAPDLPDGQEDTWKKWAIQAVKELVDAGLIHKQIRALPDGGNTSNIYSLTPRSKWKKAEGGDGGYLGGVMGGTSGGDGGYPKGTPLEGTPLEGEAPPLPSEEKAARPPAPQQPVQRSATPFLVDGMTAGQLATQRGQRMKHCQDYDWRIHRAAFEAVIDAVGKRALVDADDTKTIGDWQQVAVTLTKAGQTAETIRSKTPAWKDSYWGKRDAPPHQFISFMGSDTLPTDTGVAKDKNVVQLVAFGKGKPW